MSDVPSIHQSPTHSSVENATVPSTSGAQVSTVPSKGNKIDDLGVSSCQEILTHTLDPNDGQLGQDLGPAAIGLNISKTNDSEIGRESEGQSDGNSANFDLPETEPFQGIQEQAKQEAHKSHVLRSHKNPQTLSNFREKVKGALGFKLI